MDLQTLTYLVVGASFALYIGIAFWSQARSTGEFYVAGKHVHPIANGMATAADWMSAASFISMAGLIAFLGYDPTCNQPECFAPPGPEDEDPPQPTISSELPLLTAPGFELETAEQIAAKKVAADLEEKAAAAKAAAEAKSADAEPADAQPDDARSAEPESKDAGPAGDGAADAGGDA